MKLTLELNGELTIVDVNPGLRLIDWLRNELNLTGTKEGCGEGECGTCTVLLNDQPVNSCLVLMGQLDGARVQTIEGIRSDPDGLRLMQAFCEMGAIQCGFCTPGLIMAALPLVKKHQPLSAEEVKQSIAGNLCRCTGYQKIIDAIMLALGEQHE